MKPRSLTASLIAIDLVGGFCGCATAPTGTGQSECNQALIPGDLVVSEILANPDGADGDQEYIEIYNASTAAIGLEGVALAASKADGAGEKTHKLAELTLDSGDYLVLGNAPLDQTPAHVDYSYGNSLGSLRNSDGRVAVTCAEIEIDQVMYATTSDGHALQLDGFAVPDYLQNDDPAAWCEAPKDVQFRAGNYGTPGARNALCADLQRSDCVDGNTVRPIVVPTTGQLKITEWLANPAGTDDEKEWFEVRSSASVDLNGLVLSDSSNGNATVLDAQCIRVSAGNYAVFSRNLSADQNGGLPFVTATFGFALNNSGTESIRLSRDGVTLDEVIYVKSTSSAATQVDGNEATCNAVSAYGDGNLGTPGAENPLCN